MAYLAYRPVSWFSITGGRLGDPFFHATTLVWADDLSLEGVVMSFVPQLSNDFSLFATAGLFPIQDIPPAPTNAASPK